MGSISKSYVLLVLILVTVSSSLESKTTEARTLSVNLPAAELARNSKIFATLGVVCKCCDGEEEGKEVEEVECRSKWEGSCLKLHCFPWKNDLPSKPLFSH